MTHREMQINRLRRRHGLPFARAALIAALAYGEGRK